MTKASLDDPVPPDGQSLHAERLDDAESRHVALPDDRSDGVVIVAAEGRWREMSRPAMDMTAGWARIDTDRRHGDGAAINSRDIFVRAIFAADRPGFLSTTRMPAPG